MPAGNHWFARDSCPGPPRVCASAVLSPSVLAERLRGKWAQDVSPHSGSTLGGPAFWPPPARHQGPPAAFRSQELSPMAGVLACFFLPTEILPFFSLCSLHGNIFF